MYLLSETEHEAYRRWIADAPELPGVFTYAQNRGRPFCFSKRNHYGRMENPSASLNTGAALASGWLTGITGSTKTTGSGGKSE